MYIYIHIYISFNLFPKPAFHPKAMLPGKLPGASRAAVVMRTLPKAEKINWQTEKTRPGKSGNAN